MSSSNQKLILGYWDIHGLASPVRFLLEVAGVQYEEELYNIADADAWFNVKKKELEKSMPFVNLPYIIDGDVKMSEHLAIMRYLGRKHGLAPKTEQEIQLSDMTESLSFDIRFSFYKVAYDSETHEKSKAEFMQRQVPKLAYLNNLFSKNEFTLGNRLTYVDIVVYDLLILLRAFEPSIVNSNANLVRFIETINKLPNITAYYTSSRWKKRSFCAPFAHFKGEF